MALSRATITKAVTAAFKSLGDIPESVTLRRTTSTYTPSTGAISSTSTDYTLSKAIFTKYQVFEIDKVFILTTDVKMIVRQSELSVTPTSVSDTIIRDSKTYNIIRITEDPASATYTFQLRSP